MKPFWVLMLGPNIRQVIKDLRKTCLQEPKNWKKIEKNRRSLASLVLQLELNPAF